MSVPAWADTSWKSTVNECGWIYAGLRPGYQQLSLKTAPATLTLSQLCNDGQYLNFPLNSSCRLCFHVEPLTWAGFPSKETQLYSPSSRKREESVVELFSLTFTRNLFSVCPLNLSTCIPQILHPFSGQLLVRRGHIIIVFVLCRNTSENLTSKIN